MYCHVIMSAIILLFLITISLTLSFISAFFGEKNEPFGFENASN